MHRARYYLTLLLPLLPPTNKVCEGYVCTGVCLSTGGLALCPGGSPLGGSLSKGISVQGGVCLGVSVWGVSVWGVSVQGVSVWGISVQGGFCPGVSVQGGVCLVGLCPGGLCLGGLCPGGVSVRETPVQLRTGGMHPTVMHSCYLRHYFLIFCTIY